MPTSEEIIFGTRAVTEAIDAGKEIEKLLIQKGLKNKLSAGLLSKLDALQIPLQEVPVQRLNRITRKNHQGVIGFLSAISYSSIDHMLAQSYGKGHDPLLVMLDGVTDVRNFGAIARSSECLGVHGLVVPDKGSAMLSGDAMKTSAGALNYLPVTRTDDLLVTADTLRNHGLSIVACSEKGSKMPAEIDFSRPTCLILGSEDQGINKSLVDLCDDHCQIPMAGHIASLNVSVAAGIMLYEVARQRNPSSNS